MALVERLRSLIPTYGYAERKQAEETDRLIREKLIRELRKGSNLLQEAVLLTHRSGQANLSKQLRDLREGLEAFAEDIRTSQASYWKKPSQREVNKAVEFDISLIDKTKEICQSCSKLYKDCVANEWENAVREVSQIKTSLLETQGHYRDRNDLLSRIDELAKEGS